MKELSPGQSLHTETMDAVRTIPPTPLNLESLEQLFFRLLQLVGEDPHRAGLIETPTRMAKAWQEMLSGYETDPQSVMKLFDVEGPNQSEIVIVRDVPFSSLCEHHGLPFTGKVHLAYIPNGKIIGLSKVPRLVDILARRLQVQERLTAEIADEFMEGVKPMGVMVVATAVHECMELRGVKAHGSSTITSALRGVFQYNPEAKREVLQLLGL